MGQMGPFEQLIFIVVGAATVCWVASAVINLFRRREQLRAASQFQRELLQRAGTAHEFLEVLNSDAGLKLIQALATEQEVRPEARIFKTFLTGLTLFIVGFVMLVYWDDNRQAPDSGNIGVITFALLGTGIALLVASLLSLGLWRVMRRKDRGASGGQHTGHSGQAAS
jgi:hypothetical protein